MVKPIIFVSSVSRELKTARQLVANTLLALGYEPDWQDIFETSSDDLREMLRKKVNKCSAVLQIVGHAYGAEPPQPDETFGRVSYTQYEALYARSRKKPVYYLMAEDDLPRDATADMVDSPRDNSDAANKDAAARQHLQAVYRQAVLSAGQVYYPVRNSMETELSVRRLRDDLARLRRGFRFWMIGITAALVMISSGIGWLIWGRDPTAVPRDLVVIKNDLARIEEKLELLKVFEPAFRQVLIANKEITADQARQATLKLVSATAQLSPEDVLAIIDSKLPASTPEAPVTPLERARIALAQGKYDDVFDAARDELQASREMAMLEGTAALAKFREEPKREWNERAAAAFLRALHLCDPQSEPLSWAEAATEAATVMCDLSQFEEAEPLLCEALKRCEETLNPHHEQIANALNNLAMLLRSTGRLAEAEPLMRRSLAIGERSFGPEHPTVATTLLNLATLLQGTKRWAEAEALMRRALAIFEKSGGDTQLTACALNNLAIGLLDPRPLVDAESLMRRALRIDEQYYGTKHHIVARDMNNLALLLRPATTNRLAEAEPLYRRALAIYEQSFGPEHPDVAYVVINLAELMVDTKRLAGAEPLIRRALAIDEKSLRPDHPNIGRDLTKLATFLYATDRLAEAEPLWRRAIEIREQHYGTEDPDVGLNLYNVAMLLKATHRLAESEPLLRRSVTMLHRFGSRTGAEHPQVRVAIEYYVTTLELLNLPATEIEQRVHSATSSDQILEPIVPEIERLLGPAKPVADVLAALDQQYKAEVKPAVFFLTPDQPIVPHLDGLLKPNASWMSDFAFGASVTGAYADAVVMFDEAVRLDEHDPADTQTSLEHRMNHAIALRELGVVDRAREELRRLLSEMDQDSTTPVTTIAFAHLHLALCEWLLGQVETAKRELEESRKLFGDEPNAADDLALAEQLLVDLAANKPLPALPTLNPDADLEQARSRFRARAALASLPLDESALPLLDQILGPAKSTQEVFDALDRQYRDEGRPEVWFLPISEPISPHLDELLGPIPGQEQ